MAEDDCHIEIENSRIIGGCPFFLSYQGIAEAAIKTKLRYTQENGQKAHHTIVLRSEKSGKDHAYDKLDHLN